MAIKDTVNNAFSNWMDGSGPENDIVVSSRIRVARNLASFPFPHMLDVDKADEVIHGVVLALRNEKVKDNSGYFESVRMRELGSIDRQILVEKHLISPDLLKDYNKKAVAIRDDEIVSIMINEEDHLRIQCLLPGLKLESAWDYVNKLDEGLEKTLDYAFCENTGYLTACPTNVGTGLRASVMVHLPGLVHAQQIKNVLVSLSKLGLAVRGLYGEGTEAAGNLFQVSNQVTLGHTEAEIIQSLVTVTAQLLEQERAAREALYKERKDHLEDRIWRSYGVLKHSRIIASDEAMKRFSDIRLGIDLGIIDNIDQKLVTELMILSQPAFLLKRFGQEMTSFQRDVSRAQIIRNKIENPSYK